MRSMPEKKIEKLKRGIAYAEQQIEISQLRIKTMRKMIDVKQKHILEIKAKAIFKETTRLHMPMPRVWGGGEC